MPFNAGNLKEYLAKGKVTDRKIVMHGRVHAPDWEVKDYSAKKPASSSKDE